jgi:HAD superfamily hydrolase (TIGR01509 family)
LGFVIRAVLFDFNGVIVDDEPVHFKLFQKVLAEEGVQLSREAYYQKYLGMDDVDCFKTAGSDLGKKISESQLQGLIDRKAKYYMAEMKKNPPFIPGALELVKTLGKTHFVAVVSGALRSEIEMLLRQGGVAGEVSVIVAAGEVAKGKPDPEGFLQAIRLLNRDWVASSERLFPEECLAVEDSTWGIQAARKAGLSCVALTTSYKEKDLPGAVLYLKDFSGAARGQFLEKLEAGL